MFGIVLRELNNESNFDENLNLYIVLCPKVNIADKNIQFPPPISMTLNTPSGHCYSHYSTSSANMGGVQMITKKSTSWFVWSYTSKYSRSGSFD